MDATACAKMIGPVVHGPVPATPSRIFLLGQAPGPHEGGIGKPFAWTAGKTLFRWFFESSGITEDQFRASVYMAAVARCFPGKARGGGDRRPDDDEIRQCRSFLEKEVAALVPTLILPIGTLAIEQVMAEKKPLAEVIGHLYKRTYHGFPVDVLPLPHPSGASTWHRMEPGKTLLTEALRLFRAHPEVRKTFDLV